ncbi:DoxX family protein [Salsipaludibacter albus]|uniref:DoxX family protein n=1 Tax=Salsipaludibacter albus TaxID=2849650 RepID=UPI001EE4A82B|nr:DoxX family protein [Salsipaludibacter albus]MBY5162292.1 DoxX family protein [Salsipaludibacter albus]
MMRLLTTIARAMVAAPFVVLGLDAAREPGGRVDLARDLGVPEPELAVRANGVGMVVGGAAVATGVAPAAGAVTVAGLMVPTTLAAHAWWRDEDPAEAKADRIQFWKNVGLVGGLLVVAAASRHQDQP